MIASIIAVFFMIASIFLAINIKTELVPVKFGSRAWIAPCILIAGLFARLSPNTWIPVCATVLSMVALVWANRTWRKRRRRGVTFTMSQLAGNIFMAGCPILAILLLVIRLLLGVPS